MKWLLTQIKQIYHNRLFLIKNIMKVVIPLFALLFIYGSCSRKLTGEKLKKEMEEYENVKEIYKVVGSKMQLSDKDTICDIAAGWGYSVSALANYLPANTQFYEEDINHYNCTRHTFRDIFKFYKSKANLNNFHFKIGRKTEIPYPSNKFNNVLLFISVHEFEEKAVMLDEIRRIMRDTGKLFLLETIYKDTLVKDPNCGFYYLSKENLYSLIDMAKLKIISDTTLGEKDKSDNTIAKFLICTKRND